MSTNTGPNQVLIIRHGEKVGDPKKDDDGGRHLSIQGSARAAALPTLFVSAQPQLSCGLRHKLAEFHGHYHEIPTRGKAPRFPTPNFIFATERTKHSKRPIETATPLATALNLPINDGYGESPAEIKKMTNAILKELAFAGKIVLICWHHGTIPDVAKALGVLKPPKWDGKVFDRVWQITFPQGKAVLKDLPQMLLYGDSAK
jgi:broad specificity phosphatase PhoE